METKRMPRSQFLKLAKKKKKIMKKKKKKKNTESKCSTKKNININSRKSLQSALFSKFNNNKGSFSCEIISDLETIYCKLPRKKKSRLEIAL